MESSSFNVRLVTGFLFSVFCVWTLFGTGVIAAESGHLAEGVTNRQRVTGVVFADKNASGIFDEGDRPLAGVRVSNGRDVVLTDANGRYELPIDGDAEIFVIKPRNYQAPLNADNLPQFYYLHRPDGSATTRYAGISPTGPLPESVDFPLIPQREPDEFDVVIFGDPQPRNTEEIDYTVRVVVEELVAEGIDQTAAFGVSLGDIVFDDMDMFAPLNAAIAQIGLPWTNVLGNHDCNFDAPHVDQSFETFRRVYGPDYYAFDYGPAHFIVLNTITWHEGETRRYYRGGLHGDQLAFVANNLEHVPDETLVVFLMHIPFVDSTSWNEGELEAFYQIIEDRPHTLSFAAHTHSHKHRFLDREDGWPGEQPHHHIIHGTICGAWWSGAPDEYGIPITMMGDGTPNGYGVLTVSGNSYRHRYKAFGRPADFQMHIDAPTSVSVDDAEAVTVFANIFNAWPDAEVTMRIGDKGPWVTMERTFQPDPVYLAYVEQNARTPERFWRNPPRPRNSRHLWSARLPEPIPARTFIVEVQAVNPDGQIFRGVRAIRVEP